jgi:hypothetical protein
VNVGGGTKNNMDKASRRELYFYIASLILLLLIISFTTNALWNIVQATILPFKPVSQMTYYEAKQQLLSQKYGSEIANATVSEEEVKAFMEKNVRQSQRLSIRSYWINVVTSIPYLLVLVLLYLYNQRRNRPAKMHPAYFYAVCFIVIMFMLYTLNDVTWQVSEIATTRAPSPLVYVDYEEARKRLLQTKYGISPDDVNAEMMVHLDDKEVVAFVNEENQQYFEDWVYSKYRETANDVVKLLVFLPIFLYHWKMAHSP